ncbi:MAG: FecR domain-containing protein, partial [Bacteroidales bacterium]|jgi:ferric-dicitrate binding protein FerR (iron transport regulator)|nr:FecR domain-containing protein [Bacteroidales bacterium]
MPYLQETIPEEDRRKVEEWLQDDPANEEELMQVARICHAFQTGDRIRKRNTQASFGVIERKIRQRRLKLWMLRTAGAAACLALGAVLSAVLFYRAPVQEELVYHTIEVPSGQRVKLLLADGSLVWLNAQTRFTYPAIFGKGARRVMLDGEGLFEVAPDADRPFTVQTAGHDVTALGTTFDVYAYGNSDAFETVLIDGSVEVAARDDAGNRTGVWRMKPGYRLWYDERTQQIQTFCVSTDEYISWTNGLYHFNDITFAEMIRRLEHYHKTQIIIRDSSIMNYRCTGKFRQHESITDIMDVVKSDMPFNYSYDKDLNRMIISKREKKR